MKCTNITLFFIAVVMLSLSACKKHIATVSFKMTHQVWGAPFEMGKIYAMPDGRKFKFTKAQFFISGITFGSTQTFDKYFLVLPDDKNYEIGTIEKESFSQFSFNVGVDETANHSDPTSYPPDHALSDDVSSDFNTHWSWNSGYRFVVLEGNVDTSAAMTGILDEQFIFHLGMDEVLRRLQFAESFSSDDGEEVDLNLIVDWGKFFQGLDLRLEHSTQSGTPAQMILSNKVADNAAVAITQ